MFEVKGIPIYKDEIEILRDLRTDVELKTGKQILKKIKPSGDNKLKCDAMDNINMACCKGCQDSRVHDIAMIQTHYIILIQIL